MFYNIFNFDDSPLIAINEIIIPLFLAFIAKSS